MLFQRLYPYGVFRVPCPDKNRRTVYLTFDDGVIPEVTPKVLEILKKYGVKATFFMVGENVDKYPEIYRQVIADGHSVGNHTYHHVKGFRMSKAAYLEEVRLCEEAFAKHANKSEEGLTTRLMRPPYGRATICQRRALAKMGYTLYFWDVLTHDYNANYSPERMLSLIYRYTRNGSIINFHDSLKSNERMLATLPKAIEWLQAQGYTLSAL